MYISNGCSIDLFTLILAHAHKDFRTATDIYPHCCLHWLLSEMSKRESFKKLNKQSVVILAREHGIEVEDLFL